MILSQIFVTLSCTNRCTCFFTGSGVFLEMRKPEWILPWYWNTRIHPFWSSLRSSRYCLQSQQMPLETSIFIGVIVYSDSIALSAKVNSQWQEVVTVAFPVVSAHILRNLVSTSVSVTCSWSVSVASLLSRV